MDVALRPGVAASNALTARWVGACADRAGNFVLSGAAVWPLLAILASGAGGQVRVEIEQALGLASDPAFDEAIQLLESLRSGGCTNAALGVWARNDVPIRRGWRRSLPKGVLGRLNGDPHRDQAALDSWARKETFGMLDRLPVSIEPETLLILAQALALKAEWWNPFVDFSWEPQLGPWSHRELHGLSRIGSADDVHIIETACGSMTAFRAALGQDIEVYLVLAGEDVTPTDVLVEAIRSLPEWDGRPGSELAVGESPPGVVVTEEEVVDAGERLRLRTVRFHLETRHDLLSVAEIFGLVEATSDRADFTPISDVPLKLNAAVQSARASFTATGFEAAAVTAFAVTLGASIKMDRRRARVLDVSFDRPFAFVALDRSSRLLLFAGWVEEPAMWSPEAADRARALNRWLPVGDLDR